MLRRAAQRESRHRVGWLRLLRRQLREGRRGMEIRLPPPHRNRHLDILKKFHGELDNLSVWRIGNSIRASDSPYTRPPDTKRPRPSPHIADWSSPLRTPTSVMIVAPRLGFGEWP